MWDCQFKKYQGTKLHISTFSKANQTRDTDIYRKRWEIELLWKFLKMHLKLDRLMTKSPQGIEIQIYSSLIAYLFLHLIEILEEFFPNSSTSFAMFEL
ncbi:MAG TPA: transposase [Oscillatoriales cyanobacterium M59_W2019_021]|nr:transposase [Oscillatoriales cyanobacterium M59_W2019_021]